MLVIHPDECIDCGVCEPECPANAILPDTEPGLEDWIKLNHKYSLVWPVLTVKRDQEPDAEKYDGEEGKLAKYFSEKPGEGDWFNLNGIVAVHTWKSRWFVYTSTYRSSLYRPSVLGILDDQAALFRVRLFFGRLSPWSSPVILGWDDYEERLGLRIKN